MRRIVEKNLGEHIRQENAAYREIARKRAAYQITTQRALRRLFWETFPDLPRKKIPNYSGNGTMHRTDTRCAWCDWIDSLSRDGTISQELAQRATLE